MIATLAVASMTFATADTTGAAQAGHEGQAVKMIRLMTLEDARQIADAAQARADEDEWTVAIAIVDAGGHLLYFRRMDGTPIGIGGLAIGKAESSLFFKSSTKDFQDWVSRDGMIHLMNLDNFIAIEGGFPIEHDGQVIGAIGISGATAEEDGIIAEAGVAVFQ